MEKSIALFATTTIKLKDSELIDNLSNKVPNYMIPAFLKIIPKIPLTNNGKVDRRQLLGMLETKSTHQKAIKYPETKTQRRMFPFWKEILKSKNFGINEDFFDLGGHSISALNLLLKLNSEKNVKKHLT